VHARTSSNGDLGGLRIFHRVVRWNASGRSNRTPMMHDAKKSDPLILPTKPANKDRQLSAEWVEGSGGLKRSANLQSTVRAQSREAVSQAQVRIREAKNRGFASLLERGAGCGKAARPDLPGGRAVMRVPTGIQNGENLTT